MTRTKKNILLNTMYNILTLFYPFIIAPYISRRLGTEGIGRYNYTFSVATYFFIFAKTGLENYGNRCISVARDDRQNLSKAFSSIYGMQFFTGSTIAILYFIYAMSVPNENKLYFLIQFGYVLSALFDINWLFFGLEKFKLTIIRSAFVKIISLLLIFLLVKRPNDLAAYTVIMAGSLLTSQLILWLNIHKYILFQMPDIRSVLSHIKPNLLFFIPVIAINLYGHMGKVILGSMNDIAEVALFENGEKIATVVSFSFIQAFNTVMLPKASNWAAKNKSDQVRKSIVQTMQILMLFASALSFGISAAATEFAPLYLGAEFAKSGVLAMYMSPMILASAWASCIRTQYLIPYMREKIYVGSVVSAAILNLVINYLLIGSYGATGAAIAAVVAQFTVAIYQTVAVRKELPIRFLLSKTIPYILSGGIMFTAVRGIRYLLPLTGIPLLFAEILVGAAVYITLVLSYLLISKSEILEEIVHVLPIRKYFSINK